jgi:hypothetical protein
VVLPTLSVAVTLNVWLPGLLVSIGLPSGAGPVQLAMPEPLGSSQA